MWKDCTSYIRGDKERIPKSFEVKTENLRIVITCGHIHYPGAWIMHCSRLGIDTHPLPSAKTLEDAQKQAIEIVERILLGMLQSLETFKGNE